MNSNSQPEIAFSKNELQSKAKEYMILLYGKPGQGNDADKWLERFGLLCGFIDEQFSPTNQAEVK